MVSKGGPSAKIDLGASRSRASRTRSIFLTGTVGTVCHVCTCTAVVQSVKVCIYLKQLECVYCRRLEVYCTPGIQVVHV